MSEKEKKEAKQKQPDNYTVSSGRQANTLRTPDIQKQPEKKKYKKCVQECQKRLRDKVKICDSLFNSPGSVHYHNTKWHSNCLAQARTEFDNCMSLCR